ncbi:unnamed protein product [Rotaria magnacalcarata]|uniref:Helix-turn-helix domain-containing protein n=1 Tax=Rotaria magnacalcarata TaxID=392030 RepID=A0A820VXJ2_9BILA|nr:unnamed protein product [Rotaria magnacalcarata]
MLDLANHFHPSIKLVRHIGKMYHKAVAEPYIVPFKFGLPRHVFNNIIDTALLRVIRYSSVLSAFNEERQSIELMLLYNWYPPRYIHSRFHKFFARYLSLQTILPLLNDNSDLALMRCLSLNEPTLDEKKDSCRDSTTRQSKSEPGAGCST